VLSKPLHCDSTAPVSSHFQESDMTHDFNEKFSFSTSGPADALVRRTCYRLVHNCAGVARATPAEDRAGVDYWVILPRNRVGLDAKVRTLDYAARQRKPAIDCVLELDGYGQAGWLFKPSAAQLIMFGCLDTGRVALFLKTDLQTAVTLNAPRWLAQGLAKEIATTSYRDGREWTNRAVIVSADLLTSAIERLTGAANDDHRGPK
jgi:hypothetical protein